MPDLFKNYLVMAVMSAVFLVLAYPGLGNGIWFFAWIALVPAFFALENKNLKQSFFIGALIGFLCYLVFTQWLFFAVFRLGGSCFWAIIFWACSCIFPAIFFGIFFLVYKFLEKNFKNFLFIVPAFWVALEFIEFNLFKGYPWICYFLGTSQYRNARIIQISSFTSVLGVSFLIVLFNLCFYLFLKNRNIKQILPGIVVICVCLFYGFYMIDVVAKNEKNNLDKIKVSVLDGNIDSLVKWDNQEETGDYIAHTYINLSENAAKENPNLIVWTETAIPWPMEPEDDLIKESLNKTSSIKAYHLIGMPSYATEAKDKFYNSVFFVDYNKNILDRYDKSNLLDFIEKDIDTPPASFIKIHPFVKNLYAGAKNKILSTPLGKISVIICNENLYFDYVRNSVKNGAEFITLMGNDSLLYSDAGKRQHFGETYFRAVENRRDIVVAVNSGISGAIDSFGRTIKKSFEKKADVITFEIKKNNEISFYTRYGDIFAYLCLIVSFSVLALIFYKKYGK